MVIRESKFNIRKDYSELLSTINWTMWYRCV